jgi:hypothetical protein
VHERGAQALVTPRWNGRSIPLLLRVTPSESK